MGIVNVSREKFARILKELGLEKPALEDTVDMVSVARSALERGVSRRLLDSKLAGLGLSANERAAVFAAVDKGREAEKAEEFNRYEFSRDPLVSIRREGWRIREFTPPEE